MVPTMVSSGLRWGEITALLISDLQVVDGTVLLRVNKAWKRDDDFRY
jgi:integrase